MRQRLRAGLGRQGLSVAGAILVLAGLAFVGWRLSAPAGSALVAGEATAAQGRSVGPTVGGGGARSIMVFRGPGPEGYRSAVTVTGDESVSMLALPEFSVSPNDIIL